MNIETLLNNVIAECEMAMKLAEQESGTEIDIDELSDEEDEDYIQDNQLSKEMAMVSNPILMAMSQQIIKSQINLQQNRSSTDVTSTTSDSNN